MIAAVLLLGGAVVLTAALHVGPAANLLSDSGVESSKAIAAQKSANNPNDTSGPVGKTTQADYQAARAKFASSRYSDLRTAGTHFLDLVWQAQGSLSNANSDTDLGSALLFIGPLISAYTDLAGACANHGVVLPPLSTSGGDSTTSEPAPGVANPGDPGCVNVVSNVNKLLTTISGDSGNSTAGLNDLKALVTELRNDAAKTKSSNARSAMTTMADDVQSIIDQVSAGTMPSDAAFNKLDTDTDAINMACGR